MSADARIGIARGQLPLELGHEPSLAEADFSVSETNELAYAHVASYPDWPSPLTLIVGPAKSGKSHLARIFAERSGAIAPLPHEIERLATEGGQGPLIVEDVDRLDYDEAALFHLLNQSMRDARPLLLTAREPVAAWPYRTEDVRSRARLAAAFTVDRADDTQLSQILIKLYADRQVSVDERVIAYIVARMERSPEEAVVLAELTDRLALARGTAITRTIAAEALALRGNAQLELDLEGDGDE
jgi:chromosomal replication initiation ATPase DnaA